MPLALEGPLPVGWTACSTKDGVLFVNHHLRRTTYVDPRLSNLLPQSLKALPDGWELDVDGKLIPYFLDHVNGKTVRTPEWLTSRQLLELQQFHQLLQERFGEQHDVSGKAASEDTGDMSHRNDRIQSSQPGVTASSVNTGDDELCHFQRNMAAPPPPPLPPSPDAEKAVWTLQRNAQGCYFLHEPTGRASWADPALLRRHGVILEQLPPSWDAGIDAYGPFVVSLDHQATFRVPFDVDMPALVEELNRLHADLARTAALEAAERAKYQTMTSETSDQSAATMSKGGSFFSSVLSTLKSLLETKRYPEGSKLASVVVVDGNNSETAVSQQQGCAVLERDDILADFDRTGHAFKPQVTITTSSSHHGSTKATVMSLWHKLTDCIHGTIGRISPPSTGMNVTLPNKLRPGLGVLNDSDNGQHNSETIGRQSHSLHEVEIV